MNAAIDRSILSDIARHHRRLGLIARLRGLPYERCAELAWVIGRLGPQFDEPKRYLDIGSGESPLPSYIFEHSKWDVTCLDKSEWVGKQQLFVKRTSTEHRRFEVIERDLLAAAMEPETFDLITSISVVEHFEGATDSEAMRVAGRLLRPGGLCIITVPVNEGHVREFFLRRDVYGERFTGRPVFYQRHYDSLGIDERLVRPSGLSEIERVYFGDYGFQCFERVLQQPKPLRAPYMWATPLLARRFLSYRPYPVSRADMRMNTASGAILVLQKPG